MRRLVILGTGTGVGKTHVSVALLRALRSRAPSLPMLALKPVETGLGQGVSDAQRLADALDLPAAAPVYGFAAPISPHLAAARAGTAIELRRILDWISRAEAIHDATPHVMSQSMTLVESAGGAFSPLSSSATNVDLARALEPATWILVAADALGVLHDVRATLLALERYGRRPDHVILSVARGVDASTGSNAAELSALGIASPSAVLGPNGSEDLHALAEQLLKDGPAR